ncbi:hypothetical protein KOR42_25790 [Thalassoglobus neptunius]|uniref:BIG2 domain-containing protein n=1 Tax=Thalassoglobus neptunius TaxID=1938619 RepID=A0A5C5WYU9_9PLAN|nr:DUF1549 domain-containing protein [Thalassoglobus neptunius]TWT55768.1 hypothetical protein KOR42_25790 [Thalassoglobus neptunius]
MKRPTLTSNFRFFSILAFVGVMCTGLTQESGADDVIASLRDRFQSADVSEIPDFQKHVVPLMGRLGCNGRACHGSFQGQGGFRLSLFGYDFEMDHEGLSDRIDTDDPMESYALQKPTLIEPHEGGKRMSVGEWEHTVFLKWIEGGAKGVETPLKLNALRVTPSEIEFSASHQSQPLSVTAVWADGTEEDVTCLCRYTTNDETICQVDEDGIVSSGEVGDSHIVVAYDGAVVPIPVLRPVSEKTGDNFPELAATTMIDKHVVNKLSKMGIIPSETSTDAEFLRRVSLDMTGTLPTAKEVREFLADSSADKRERKIDELLESPAYAAWWTTQLCDWTGCSDQTLNNVNPANRQRGSEDWYEWIYKRVADNVPYDEIVENIVVANSRKPGESYRDYSERMSTYARDEDASYADQDGLIYFWGRNNFRATEDRAIGFAYTFMGTRIQCAQCHKHPFDVWTQKDFQEFEQFFTRVNFARNGGDRKEYNELIEELGLAELKGNEQRREMSKALKEGKTIPFPELTISQPRLTGAQRRKIAEAKKKGKKPQVPGKMARLLGEQTVDVDNIDDPRTALMDWLRQSPTQLFAKAFVNRVWASYFNRGIVEPTDDLSLGNPPSNGPLLDYLAQGFIDSGYDMKWVHREICLSDTYQRSWRPTETNIHDERNFSRAVPRRLPAEVAYDAITMATLNDDRAELFTSELDGRALTQTSPPRNARGGIDYALSVFGRSTRESNCDCDRSSEASLLQTLFVRNDDDTLDMLESRNGWLSSVSRQSQDESTNAAVKRRVENLERRMAQLQRQLKKAEKDKNKRLVSNLEKQLATVELQLLPLTEKQTANEEQPSEQDLESLIEEAYLRTVSRFPSEAEQTIAMTYLNDSEDLNAGIKDLMWALLNTKEFLVNH